MVPAARASDVRAVDAFLAEEKFLQGPYPPWIPGTYADEFMAIWLIEDSLGIARGQLRFSLRPSRIAAPSVSVIFRNNPIWRLDLEEPDVCKTNPLWAEAVRAEPRVCGSHCHEWHDNRQHILAQPIWELPCRRAIQPQIKKLQQAIPWLADQIKLTLTPDQRGFGVPSQSHLFQIAQS